MVSGLRWFEGWHSEKIESSVLVVPEFNMSVESESLTFVASWEVKEKLFSWKLVISMAGFLDRRGS